MSTNTVSIVSIVSFLSGIALFMCFQIVLYSYYDYLQYVFELVHIDLFSLISNLHPLLVFGFVFTLYQVLSYVLLCSLVRHDFYFGTAVRSNLLGSIFSLGLEISLVNYYSQYGHSTPAVPGSPPAPMSTLEARLQFLDHPYSGIYLCFLSFFHYSEFLIMALVNPGAVKMSSFMLNHSVPYHIAVVTSWIEYCAEMYFLSSYKLHPISTLIHTTGIVLCFTGEFIRKLAIFTASTNFNHIVQMNRKEGHRLVTDGIYSVFRHPSYVGWFMFSVGTQMILVNPICILGYTLASWDFFNARIYTEEEALIRFFGPEYITYQKRVKIWIPFIKGYQVERVEDVAAPGASGARLIRRES
uniref:Protein-S-isoprenylcysteine O-methyltransferase n=1 Tax=Cacopsylla melanoneura TaxID=428564 RepID=A0A8D8Q6S9_9HEMI